MQQGMGSLWYVFSLFLTLGERFFLMEFSVGKKLLIHFIQFYVLAAFVAARVSICGRIETLLFLPGRMKWSIYYSTFKGGNVYE
ncbi:hypothetical protein SAMN04487861_10996 [Selenomonas ruminantium]|uniref:Uncharacterized protein n=1 Tax=Selenomonas ruminantium TaxID=971 RepID=A0A1I3EB45_SELRU|nr:hypothetical protein SAMN04487861_10996 [Selenomonas ruminantium]